MSDASSFVKRSTNLPNLGRTSMSARDAGNSSNARGDKGIISRQRCIMTRRGSAIYEWWDPSPSLNSMCSATGKETNRRFSRTKEKRKKKATPMVSSRPCQYGQGDTLARNKLATTLAPQLILRPLSSDAGTVGSGPELTFSCP